MGEKRPLEQRPAEPRPTRLIAKLKPPAADNVDPPVALPTEHRAGSQHRRKPVSRAKSPAQRDQCVGLDPHPRKRQKPGDAVRSGRQIGPRKAEHRNEIAQVNREPGLHEGRSRGVKNAVARAFRIGPDIRRAGNSLGKNTALRIRHRSTTARTATIDSKQTGHGTSAIPAAEAGHTTLAG